MRASWVPFAWYVGIAVAVPLLNGAPLGVHIVTTLAVAGAFFLVLGGWRARSRHVCPSSTPIVADPVRKHS
jgi:hypothetical protein